MPRDVELESPAYLVGYMQGVADAGARLIGVVAAELGHDHPLMDRMVERLGQLAGAAPTGKGPQ